MAASAVALLSTAVIVIDPVVLPASMVRLVELRFTAVSGDAEIVSVVARLAVLSCVAVSVVSPSFSEIEDGSRESVTVGRCISTSRSPYFSTGYW